MKTKKLFCFDNAKTTKGIQFGYSTAILYLAASNMSGVVNLCKHASKECREYCLVTAGLAGIYPKINASRIEKTKWMHKDPAGFWAKVDREITNHENKCHRDSWRMKRRIKPAVRINGTSDIWNNDIQSIMYRHPDVRFYDYSKDINRIIDWVRGKLPLHYHLTYSYDGGDTDNALWCLNNGVNVAVVFDTAKGEELPERHWAFDVVDGDTHDLRFLNKRDSRFGCIIGLRAKGKAKKAPVGANHFVQKGVAS